MDSKKIAQKVMDRLSTVKTAESQFETKGVEAQYFQDILNERLLPTLKKEWKLSDVDVKELDWDWKPVSIKWSANFPSSSGVLNIQLMAPDQEIVLSGSVTYMDEKHKDHDHNFTEKIKLQDIETEYRDVRLGADIAPQSLTKKGKKYILSFEE